MKCVYSDKKTIAGYNLRFTFHKHLEISVFLCEIRFSYTAQVDLKSIPFFSLIHPACHLSTVFLWCNLVLILIILVVALPVFWTQRIVDHAKLKSSTRESWKRRKDRREREKEKKRYLYSHMFSHLMFLFLSFILW